MKLFVVLSALIARFIADTAPLQKAVVFHESLNNQYVTSRIVNGYPATTNQIPYQVSVLSPIGGGGSAVCGGSIISMSWILTAAHCTVEFSQHNIRAGSLNLNSGGVTRTSFLSISHPNFNPANLNNDISVISLPSPLTPTPAIQSIILSPLSDKETTFVDAQTRVSGWGQTHEGPGASQTLNWVWMNPILNEECTLIFGPDVIIPSVLCAVGWNNPNQGHCGGDSGGPLARQIEDGWEQIGIIAFGAAAGCTLGFPHGYMRTAHFATWIDEQTGIAARP